MANLNEVDTDGDLLASREFERQYLEFLDDEVGVCL